MGIDSVQHYMVTIDVVAANPLCAENRGIRILGIPGDLGEEG